MSPIEMIAKNFADTGRWLKNTVADMSDADLMQRPCPGANHGAWNLGHILGSEQWMLSEIGANVPELPAGFGDTYGSKNTKNDDPAAFMKKDELLKLFDKVHTAGTEFIKTLKPEDLAKDSPEEMRSYAPKISDVVLLQLSHLGMHMGQIQVLRRKLGKPVLF